MAVFGLLVTTQFRVTQQGPTDPGSLRGDELAQELKATQAKLYETEKDRNRLAAELEAMRQAAGSGAPVPVPQRDPALELLAGTIETHGTGVIVTLVEKPEALASKAFIRDEDLWMVLNELLAAGAEGLSVNDQRITALTGIRMVGQRMMIYKTMTNSPFEIAAIGDPAVLETALRMRGGVADTLDRWGIRITIVRSDSVRLPAFRAEPTLRYAKPGQ